MIISKIHNCKHISLIFKQIPIEINNLNKLGSAIKAISNIDSKFSINDKNDLDIFIKYLKEIGIELDKIDKKDVQLLNFNQQLSEIKAASDGTQTYQKQIQALEIAIERYKNVDMLDESQKNTLKEAKKDLSIFDQIKSRFKSLVAYLGSFASFHQVISAFKKGFTTIRELNTALTEMYKVSDETLSSLKSYQFETFDIADEVGTTAKQIQNSTADWMRLGEAMKEASESAKVSNILLNVSEFKDINEATDALVSVSRSYKDLDKIDIVDKINNIGNNYSIATDELASGLQRSAAVLQTQGNDLNKAIALITAGNAINQNVEMTSAGVRTISLRIAGTEEAKEELAALGEDVDDFIVQTSSKTQQIIKDYTAVASNAYKGVDVLDSNGNLRDTYSILLDISKVYEEIQETDKKAGTNRANALVEVLAGKNRSDIAASILQNSDMLESVYKDAQNSSGSATEELNKYLDSIDGKMAQLENRTQEFWATVINDDVIKNGIDLLSKLLGIITSIVDKGRLLPTLLGVGGITAFVKNFA